MQIKTKDAFGHIEEEIFESFLKEKLKYTMCYRPELPMIHVSCFFWLVQAGFRKAECKIGTGNDK